MANYASVRRAFNAFTSALNNTGSRIAVSEFSTVADLPLSGAARNSYTVVTDATRASIFGPYIATGYRPSGSTNWEDGLRMGRYFLDRPSAERPHLTVFITDGDPNEIIKNSCQPTDYENKVPLSANQVQSTSDSNQAKDAAVPNANAIKGQGSHILAVAVGAGLNSAASLNRIIDVSGPDVFSGAGTFDISTDDVYRVADFASSRRRCARPRSSCAHRRSRCASTSTSRPTRARTTSFPRADWDMTATASPVPGEVGAAGDRRRRDRDPDHGRERVRHVPVDDGGADELARRRSPRRTPPPSHQGSSTTPRRRPAWSAPRTPQATGRSGTTTLNGFTTTVTHESIATCTMVNRVPPAPAIDIQKATNGSDADAPPGPAVPIGDPVDVDVSS